MIEPLEPREGRNPQRLIDKVNEIIAALNTLLPEDYQSSSPPVDTPRSSQVIPVTPETPEDLGELANADPATLPKTQPGRPAILPKVQPDKPGKS